LKALCMKVTSDLRDWEVHTNTWFKHQVHV